MNYASYRALSLIPLLIEVCCLMNGFNQLFLVFELGSRPFRITDTVSGLCIINTEDVFITKLSLVLVPKNIQVTMTFIYTTNKISFKETYKY